MLVCGRNQHNIIKQLSSSQKKKRKKIATRKILGLINSGWRELCSILQNTLEESQAVTGISDKRLYFQSLHTEQLPERNQNPVICIQKQETDPPEHTGAVWRKHQGNLNLNYSVSG